jgi:hypothetical protein
MEVKIVQVPCISNDALHCHICTYGKKKGPIKDNITTLCRSTNLLFLIIFKIAFHVAELQENGTCIIGLKPVASIPLLVKYNDYNYNKIFYY